MADAAGLESSAVRSVKVADTTAPVITLAGNSALTLECGVGSYSEAGYSATDVCAGDVTSRRPSAAR